MELSEDVLSYVTDGGEERFRDGQGLPFSPFEALAACVEPIAELEADLKERRAMCKKYSKYVLMRDELIDSLKNAIDLLENSSTNET